MPVFVEPQTVPLDNPEMFGHGGYFSFTILADAHFSHDPPRKSVFDLPVRALRSSYHPPAHFVRSTVQSKPFSAHNPESKITALVLRWVEDSMDRSNRLDSGVPGSFS